MYKLCFTNLEGKPDFHYLVLNAKFNDKLAFTCLTKQQNKVEDTITINRTVKSLLDNIHRVIKPFGQYKDIQEIPPDTEMKKLIQKAR